MESKKNTNNSGFKIPKGYFDSFEDRLQTELELNTVKKEVFKTPKNYLENFEIDTTLIESKSPKVISIFNRRKLFLATSIAATVALLLTLTLKNPSNTFEDLENDTIKTFVLSETSTEDFALFLDDISLEESDFLTIDSDEFETYFDNVDLEDIITE
ncbi:hypothetical protein [Aurantibacter sp.]|uniref:hypothetical protein n=1 Tax=Aurantibacter sp. TaxID=2807103 RepID=UPI0035C8503E